MIPINTKYFIFQWCCFATICFFLFSTSTFGQAVVPATVADALSKGIPQTVIVQVEDAAAQAAAQASLSKRGLMFYDDIILAQLRKDYSTTKINIFANGLPAGIALERDYANLPMVALILSDTNALLQLTARPEIMAIFENEQYSMVLAESLPLIHANVVHALDKKGSGTTVAVLDTGVNYTLPAFGSCAAPNTPEGCRVVFAQDFAPNDDVPDAHGHGTNVSGIVLGVAPDAKIAGLDVFTGNGAWATDIISAINWVITNKATYNIVAMNLSLGGGFSTTECRESWATPSFRGARDAGVIPVVATGNNGRSNGISDPACAPGAVRVGAVFDYTGSSMFCPDGAVVDKVTCFSNSAHNGLVTLLAPGSVITSAGITMSGTSQATPHVSGAVAILRANDAFPNDPLVETVNRMTNSGAPVTDTRNNLTTPRLDFDSLFASNNDITPIISYLLDEDESSRTDITPIINYLLLDNDT